MVEPQLAESVLNQEQRRFSCIWGCSACWRRPRQHQFRYAVHFFDRVLGSLVWKSLIVLFTIVLLFGSPVQFLFTPKEADIVFDILYTLALIVFVLDMVLNMFVDPDYFGFDPFRRNRVQQFDQAKFCTYGIGSFKMWCDVASTAALFYDISFINSLQYDEEVVELRLDEYGVPVRTAAAVGFDISPQLT